MEDVREKAKELVRKLKDSSLLLGTRNSETFSIHDVVRDVGRWIARKDHHKFTVIDNVIPRQWADENTLQNCTSITLHDVLELPKRLECPQLQLFYMKTKTRFTKIPDNFFKGMPNLIVLHLIEMYLSPLPASLRLLKKLRTLNLDWCHLGDIAEIKDMENLEILVIGEDSDTKKLLPEEISQLNRLRVLDLRNCSFIIPPKTISRLTELEELYMGDWYDQREVEESVASLEELKDLSHLTALHIRVADAEILPKGLDFFKKLKRYNIVIGERWYTSRETLRTLHVTSGTNICSEDGVIKQLKGIEDLHLEGEQRVKNVLYELDGEGFPQLKRFSISNNPYIQLIVDSIPSATCEAFPLLEKLSLEKLVRLEKICNDQLRAKCFCQLTTISVIKCGKLKNLFSFSIAKHLSQLQEVRVDDCGNMEEIFSIGRTDAIDNNNEVVCDQLHSLTLRWLPRLRRICSESGIASTSQERLMPLTTDASEDQVDALPIFGEKVVFPNLKRLELNGINLKKIWPNQLTMLSRCVQSLTILIVRSCDNLKYVFSSSTLGSLKQLQHLEINDCKELEELIRIDDNCSNYVEFPSLEKLDIQSCPEIREFIFSDKVSFPSLQEIDICYMDNLKMIWQNQLIESVQYCPKLYNVYLSNCQSLKNLFPASITRSLLQLEKLHVSWCGIKEIVSKEERVDQEEAARFVFPRLSSLELYSLEELGCFYPGKHTTEWPKLRELKVDYGEKIDLFNFQKNNEGQLDVSMQQHLFMVDKAFSNLEKVTISRNHVRTICQISYLEDLFPNLEFLEVIGLSLNLEFLEVTDDESAVFPVDILVRFHNLKKLILTFGWYEAVFSFEEVEKHARTLAQIKSLCIKNRDVLKQLWKSPSASFENLKILKVSRCYRLLSLVVASTAKSLVRLEEMSIEYCLEMTEIIANEGDVLEGEIIFRRLKSLELMGLSNLTCFCSGNYTLNFPLLEKLEMQYCPKMQFFSSGVLRTPKLQQVSQGWTNYDLECDNLNTVIKQHQEKEVFSKSFLSGDDIRFVWQIFPKRTKVFSNAKQLPYYGNDSRMIWQSQFPEHIFPKVKCLHVSNDESTVLPFGIFQIFHDVAKLDLTSSSYKEIFPHEEVVFPNWEALNLSALCVEKIWHNDGFRVTFPNLTRLIIQGCGNLRNLFSSSIEFVQLQQLEICECNSLEVIIIGVEEEFQNGKMKFPRLNCMKITDLENLRRFHSVNLFEFPSLKDLEIKNCPGLEEFIFDDKVGLPNLERMTISCMDNLESIWQNQLDRDSFRKLKSLEVNDCQKLMTIFSSSIWERFLRLESLTVKSCGLVETIFQRLNFDRPEASQLRELYIDHLPNLNLIWKEDPQGMLSLENLQKVTVFLCPSLKNIFPASVAGSLVKLECLEVSDCDVEEIVARGGEGKKADDRFPFPQLKSMQLHCLPELKIFYHGHSVEWPYLKRLGLHQCDKVKVFISELDNPRQQLFLKSEDLLNVEDLQLSGKATAMKGQEDLFGLLQILELNDDKSTDFSLDIIQRYPKLKKLSLNCSSYEEIFSHGDVKKRLPQIKHLVLSELYDLKRIWKQDSKVHRNFQNLEILEVRSCFNLINLMPSSASFQNLTILEVWGCEGLKNLFTTFTAKSLEQLEKLEVFDCKMMTEVVVNKEAVTDEITFKKLKRLSLLYLQSLASFCSVKYILKFPILESLVVNECPKMKIFSGVTSAPRLRKLELNWKLIERSKEIDQIIQREHTIQRDMEKRLAGREDCDDSTSLISDRTNC